MGPKDYGVIGLEVCGLFIAHPSYEFFQGGLLAVHEDAYAVDLAGEPYGAEE